MRNHLAPPSERLASAVWSGSGLLVAAATVRVLGGLALSGARAAAPRPDELVLAALAWLGVALAGWLALGCALALGSLAPGALGHAAALLAERITPIVLRKLVTLLLGASVGSLALPPALVSSAGTTPVSTRAGWSQLGPGQAGTRTFGGPGYAPTDTRPTLAPGSPGPTTPGPVAPPRTDGPVTATEGAADAGTGPGFRPTPPLPPHDDDAAALLAPRPRPTTAAHGLVTVHRGDTLWSIARRHLGAACSDAEVAREWPRWYAANREIIGDDPDLIRAGQQLVPPGSRSDNTSTPKE